VIHGCLRPARLPHGSFVEHDTGAGHLGRRPLGVTVGLTRRYPRESQFVSGERHHARLCADRDRYADTNRWTAGTPL
jgi:hypothetical protein